MRELSAYPPEPIALAFNEVQIPAPETAADLRDYWFTIVKHFRMIATLFVGVALVTALVVFCRTLVYRPEYADDRAFDTSGTKHETSPRRSSNGEL